MQVIHRIKRYQIPLIIVIFLIGSLAFKYGKPCITQSFSSRAKKSETHIQTPQSSSNITITNTITRRDTRLWAYMAWRHPNKFEITVNGEPLNELQTRNLTDNTVTVTYEYEWVAPRQTYIQKKELMYEVTPENPHVEIIFTGWEKNNPTPIDVVHAKKLSEKVIFCQP